MTNIECTKCGDVVSVEARTVTLPYVCGLCERAIETFTQEVAVTPLTETDVEVAKFYEDIAPASSLPRTASEPELTEEFASVENTTALISDLEAQLATEQLLSNSLHESLLDADRKAAGLELEIEDRKQGYNSLLVDNESLQARLAELRQKVAFFEERQCPDLRETIDRLDKDNQTAQLQIGYLENARKKDSDIIDSQAAKIKQQEAALDLFSMQLAKFITAAISKVKSLRSKLTASENGRAYSDALVKASREEIITLNSQVLSLKTELKAEHAKSLWTRFKEQWVAEKKRAEQNHKDYYGGF